MNKRTRLYFGIVASLFIAALILGGKLPYSLFFLTLWLGVFEVASTFIAANQLEIISTLGKSEVKSDEENVIRLHLRNKSIFSIGYAHIINILPKRLVQDKSIEDLTMVQSKTDKSIAHKIDCRRRGRYNIGEAEIAIKDILGIVTIKKRIEGNNPLLVYPRLIKLDRLTLPSNRQLGLLPSLNRSIEDFSSILDLRKYNYGDSLKKIHWKVTARRGELFVKNFEYKASTGIWIFLDMCKDSYNNDEQGFAEECAVESTLAVVYYGLKNKMSVNLVCYGKERLKIEGSDVSKINSFLKSMVDVTAEGSTPLSDILMGEGRHVPWGSTIVAVTPRVDSDVYSSCASLIKLGYRGAVIEAGGNILRPREKMDNDTNCQYLEAVGAQVFRVKSSSEIKSVLEG